MGIFVKISALKVSIYLFIYLFIYLHFSYSYEITKCKVDLNSVENIRFQIDGKYQTLFKFFIRHFAFDPITIIFNL